MKPTHVDLGLEASSPASSSSTDPLTLALAWLFGSRKGLPARSFLCRLISLISLAKSLAHLRLNAERTFETGYNEQGTIKILRNEA